MVVGAVHCFGSLSGGGSALGTRVRLAAVVVMGGVGGDEYLYPKEDGRGREEARKEGRDPPPSSHAAMAAPLR